LAGFGFPASQITKGPKNWCPIYTVSASLAGATIEEQQDMEAMRHEMRAGDEEEMGFSMAHQAKDALGDSVREEKVSSGLHPLFGVDRPFFHVDLHDAVEVAVTDARRQDQQYAGSREVCTGRSSATEV
jgi:sodium-independent sulfate anion transporter 11